MFILIFILTSICPYLSCPVPGPGHQEATRHSDTANLETVVQADYHHHSVAVSDLELPHVTAETQQFIHIVTAEALTLPIGDM